MKRRYYKVMFHDDDRCHGEFYTVEQFNGELTMVTPKVSKRNIQKDQFMFWVNNNSVGRIVEVETPISPIKVLKKMSL